MEFEKIILKVWEERPKPEWSKEYNQAFENGFQSCWNNYKKEIGEWAWESWSYKKTREYFNQALFVLGNNGVYPDVLFNIAVSCLGKKEIEKRLKKLER